MDGYVSLEELPRRIGIKKGDNILFSSDVRMVLLAARRNGEKGDLNVLLDRILDAVGANGTLLLPSYNWDFCRGIPFDYRNTPCMTGSLGAAALKRPDFKRTAHPIYSFAVAGRAAEYLCGLSNKSAFGPDSPFAWLHRNRGRNILLDVSYNNSFTFAHYVEEQTGHISYRYLKEFEGAYRDENGREEIRRYSMFVRNLDLHVTTNVDALEELFLSLGVARAFFVNGCRIRVIDLPQAYPVMEKDILFNRSRRICRYDGQ